MTYEELVKLNTTVRDQFSVPEEERQATITELEVGQWPGDEPHVEVFKKHGRQAFDQARAARRSIHQQLLKARAQEAEFHPFPRLERAAQAVTDFFTPSSQPESVMDLSRPTPLSHVANNPAQVTNPPSKSLQTSKHLTLNPDDEEAFQEWYAETAQRAGLYPNADDPAHKYDMRAFWRSGREPAPDLTDLDPITKQPRLHFSSEFKDDDHPNRFVVHQGQVLDSKYNRPVNPAQLNRLATPEQRTVLESHLRAQGLLADESSAGSASAATQHPTLPVAQQPPAVLRSEPTFEERNQSFQARLGRLPKLDEALTTGRAPTVPAALQPSSAALTTPPAPRSDLEKYVVEPLKEFGKSVVYRGPVAFFDWLDRKSGQAAQAAGITRTGKSIYTKIADLARAQAEEQPTDPAWNTQFLSELGQIPTRDLPKIAAFTASLGPVWGFAGLGVLDGAEQGTKEALVEGFKGLLLGVSFKGLQGLGMKERAVAGGGLFGAQAVAEGERDPGKIAGAAATGAILGLPGRVKGETFGERLSGYRASAARPAGGNIFESLGVDPETATVSNVRRAFRDQAGVLKEATVSAKTDAERLALTKQFQDLRRNLKEAESVLGKVRPATPEALQPSGSPLALPPGTEPALLPGPPRPGEVQGETIYAPGPVELQPGRVEAIQPGRGRLPNVPPPLQPEPPVQVPSEPAGATVDTLARQIRPSLVKPSDFLPDQLAVNTGTPTPRLMKKAAIPPSALQPTAAPPTPTELTPAAVQTDRSVRQIPLVPVTTKEAEIVESGANTAAESPSVEDIHALAESKGLEWDNDKTFMEMTKQVTGKAHLDELSPEQRTQFAAKLRHLPDVSREKATTVPRSELPAEQNADLMARAEKAQADLEIAGSERGGRYFTETQGKGSDQEVSGLKSATASWYKEATTGPKKLSRDRVDKAVAKILADKGRDVGSDVQRIKELLLQDREFQSSPFAPKTDADWQMLIEAATGTPQKAVMPKVVPTPLPAQLTPTDQAAHESATSPYNALVEPTLPMKDAGNYKKGHVLIAGLDISIENPQGSKRSGTDKGGKPWSITMKDHYGYIRKTKGKDKDHLDVFIKPGTPENYSGPVFVVDQQDPTSNRFDEHKVVLGVSNREDAIDLYEQNYANDWDGLRSIKHFTMPQFKEWLKSGDHTRPAVEYKVPIETKPLIAETKAGQQEIAVPPPTIGQRPIIAREATPEEAPLFSKAAQMPEPEQTRLTEMGAPIAGQEMAQQKRVKPSTPRIPVDPIAGGSAKPLTQILIDVSQGTGQKLTKAKLGRGVAGTYFPGSTATTIRYAGDLDTTAHELSHALDDQFGIVKDFATQPTSPFDAELQPFAEHGSIQVSGPRAAPQYVRAEGVAEWFRAWLVNPKAAEAAAPQFAQHALTKLPAATRKALDQFSTDIRTFAGSTAHSKIMANVQWEAPKSGVLDWMTGGKTRRTPGFKLTWADTANAELIDRLQAFNKAIDYARRQRGLGQPPLPANDPQLLVRLYSGIHAKMDQIFEKGMIDTKNQHVTNGGLPWLVESLDPKQLDAEMQDVASYMIAQRTVEKITKEIAQSDAAIKAQKLSPLAEATAMNKAADAIRNKKISGAGGGLEKDVEVAEQHLKDLKAADPNKLARLDEAATRYRQWADANLQYLLDRGRISQEQYDGIKANNEYYVSMQRILEVSPGEELALAIPSGSGSPKLGAGRQPIQAFHGSTRTIRNPYTTLMEATYRTVREADRNYVMSLFRDLLTSDRGMYEAGRADLASVGRRVKEGDKDTIPIYKNGEKEIWQFHPDVYRALKGVDDLAMQLPAFLEVLTYPARIMRIGITKAPPFALRNLIRDAFQRTVVSNNGSRPWDSLKHYSKAEMDAMALAGGDQAGYYYRDDRSYQKAMKQAMRKLGHQRNVVVASLSKLGEGYSHIIEASERQGRMAEYRRAFKKGKTQLGYDDYNAALYAASEARGVLDFAVAGNSARVVNRFVPFLTAAINGLRVAAKAFKSHPVRTSALWFASVATPTVLTYFWNQAHGDLDEYRQLPPYQRDLFWNFKIGPDLWLTIPKPFELGAMATTIERMVDHQNGNDKAFEGHWKSLAKSMLPVDEAALFGPLQSIGSAVANYDFFRERAIVPRHEENLDLSLRSTYRASRLGQVLQEAIGVDARKIDFVVENQLGYFGRYLTSASDIGRTDRQGFGSISTGVLRGDPVETARDVKWVHDLAVERGALATTEWKRFQRLKTQYHQAEGAEQREQRGREVREAATRLRSRWEARPPRPDAEKKLEKKRMSVPDDPVMRYFRPG